MRKCWHFTAQDLEVLAAAKTEKQRDATQRLFVHMNRETRRTLQKLVSLAGSQGVRERLRKERVAKVRAKRNAKRKG